MSSSKELQSTMNIFKLVSLESPHKIDLPVGSFFFGRGKLIKCNDKRVSRNHGELEVAATSITIRSLNSNPCFYMKKGSRDKELLKLNCSVVLTNGDSFGVLPETCWYELVYCPDSHVPPPDPKDIPSIDQNNSRLALNPSDNPTQDTDATNRYDASQPLEFDLNETARVGGDSPSLISTQDVNPELADPKTPVKRCSPSESSSYDAKKVKKEPDDNNEGLETKPNYEEDVRPGPSNPNVVADSKDASSKDGNSDNGPDSPSKPKVPTLRERCMYGANCYRRNPQHKAQFSHPADADWGAGAQAPCPRGAACARADPRHWRDHCHPPGTAPPPPTDPGMRVVHRHGNIFYINARTVNFYEDHFQVEDSDGDSVDYDYEF